MGNDVDVKTPQALLQALRNAASKTASAQELAEQRVSFVFGMVGEKSGVTREQIREVIEKQNGTQPK